MCGGVTYTDDGAELIARVKALAAGFEKANCLDAHGFLLLVARQLEYQQEEIDRNRVYIECLDRLKRGNGNSIDCDLKRSG